LKAYQFILPGSFGSNAQKYLKYFLVFTAWPVLSIGLSITLYLFGLLLLNIKYKTGTYYLKIGPKSMLFYLFGFVALISLMYSPWDVIPFKFLDDIQLQVQYFYWMLVAIFFMNTYNLMNKSQFNRMIFIGLALHTFQFFFVNFSSGIPFVKTTVTRNGFVFTVLALWPLASGYIYERYGNRRGNWALIFAFFIMLLTDGRAGVVIILIENIFIYFLNNKTSARVIRGLVTILVPFFIFFGDSMASDENRAYVGDLATKISPRIGDFIKGQGDAGDLSFDKSWLTRKLMLSKGEEILRNYPYFGVGIGHFTEYKSELEEFDNFEFQRLRGSEQFNKAYYNAKSSHNSYLLVISEMGIIGFIALLLVLVPPMLFSLWKLYMLTITKKDLILISFVGICIHFYTITSLPGTLTWFVIGLTFARIYRPSVEQVKDEVEGRLGDNAIKYTQH
jgi:hypothetical protein